VTTVAQLTVPVLALVGVLVSSRNWPTLGRRIRDHTALVKDMPSEVSTELRALLTDEVAELVRRDRRRLDPWLGRIANARRGIAVAVAASTPVFVVAISTLFTEPPPESSQEISATTAAAIFAGLATAAVAGTVVLGLANRRRYQRVEDRLESQRKAALATQRAKREAQDAARRAGGLPPLDRPLPSMPPMDPRLRRQRKTTTRVAGVRPRSEHQ
jgi:hypothetical protein